MPRPMPYASVRPLASRANARAAPKRPPTNIATGPRPFGAGRHRSRKEILWCDLASRVCRSSAHPHDRKERGRSSGRRKPRSRRPHRCSARHDLDGGTDLPLHGPLDGKRVHGALAGPRAALRATDECAVCLLQEDPRGRRVECTRAGARRLDGCCEGGDREHEDCMRGEALTIPGDTPRGAERVTTELCSPLPAYGG